MAEPFLSEIRIMSAGYAPRDWAQCNGQLLPINQNQALFALLGTTFGGNGVTTFALPDLRARTPIHVGDGHALGERAGEPAHVLATAELPLHAHAVAASSATGGGSATANNNFLGGANNVYRSPSGGGTLTTLQPATVTSSGAGQAHENMQPFLTLTFCIALTGIFPSPNASFAQSGGGTLYQAASDTQLAPHALPSVGGGQPHDNLQPYLTLYFNIALQGVFPPRT